MISSERVLCSERSPDLRSCHARHVSETTAKAATEKYFWSLQNSLENCDENILNEKNMGRPGRWKVFKKYNVIAASKDNFWIYSSRSEEREHGDKDGEAEDNEESRHGTIAGDYKNFSSISRKLEIREINVSEKADDRVCDPGTTMDCSSTSPHVQSGPFHSAVPAASTAMSNQSQAASKESCKVCGESDCSCSHTDRKNDCIDKDEESDVDSKPELSQLVLRSSFKNIVQTVSHISDVAEVFEVSGALRNEDTKSWLKPTPVQTSRGTIFSSTSVRVHEDPGKQIRKVCPDPNQELRFQSETKYPVNFSTYLSSRFLPRPFKPVIVSHPSIFVDFRNVPAESRMRYEVARLATFHPLSTLAVSAIRLAMAGFYYDQEIDEIKCFSCGKCKREWSSSDNPAMVHLEISPNCKHANFQDETNVPIDERNYTLRNDSTTPPTRQNTTQPPQLNGQSDDANSQTVATFGLGQAARPGVGNEPLSTSTKNQMRHSSGNADTRSATVVDSSLTPFSLQTDGESPSQLFSNPLKTGAGDLDFPYAEPGRDGKSNQYVPQAPLQITVCTTLELSGEKYGKRYPVQAQQPGAVTFPFPTVETGRLAEPRDSGQRENILDPPTPGLDVQQAASPGNTKIINRLMSFGTSWSTFTTGQNPKDLAMAGFFSLGAGDSVRCFYCAITLREWKPGDDPWTVHVLARFSCGYIKAVKGDNFVMKTLIEHGRGQRSRPPGHGQLQLPSSTYSPGAQAASERRTSSQPTLTAHGGSVQSANRENRNVDGSSAFGNTGPPSSAAPVVSPARFASAAATNAGEVSSTLARSRDVREEVRPNGQLLQMDCDAADGSGSRAVVSNPAPVTGVPSTASAAAAAESQTGSGRLAPVNPNLDAQLRHLVETNRRLRERRTCKLCHTRTVDTIFLPCGHICTCETCAKSIKSCIVCRKGIRGTAHVYLD